MKARAVAHTMEGLVKYHGLRDWSLRLPYHDSISVNLDAFTTTTEVEFGDFGQDTAFIDNTAVTGREFERIRQVVDHVRRLANISDNFRVVSFNSIPKGRFKGLGFSSSAGAALAAAAYKASGLDSVQGWDMRLVSRIARRLAGSACRSVVGNYARWYAGNSDEDSYAVSFAYEKNLPLKVVVVPLGSRYSTEDAHREAELSTFFEARIKNASARCDVMEKAIKEGDFKTFGELKELDTIELHAVTATGPRRLIIAAPESLKIVSEVRRLREEEGVECYFSMQTGPTVFINTHPEDSRYVYSRVEDLGFTPYLSGVGGPVRVE
ncbi:MAG: diphosphomevalonate decarboxylase [Candidatus Caldarchaeum sp.]